MGSLFAIAAAVVLAFANGANDTIKGVATLYGCGALSFPRALRLATLATAIGGAFALATVGHLADSFGGKGLVPDSLARTSSFAAIVGLAAGATVLLATRFGMPTSTTHALTGALLGAGWIMAGDALQTSVLGRGFFLPLVVSPVISAALAALLYPVARSWRADLGLTEQSCVCVAETPAVSFAMADGRAAPAVSAPLQLISSLSGECDSTSTGNPPRLAARPVLDLVHALLGATVCAARALNDTPKLAGLLLVSGVLAPQPGVLLIVLSVALGGWLFSGGIAETMGLRAASMNPGSAIVANAVTAVLVLSASVWQLPVSTTHVACGAIFGIGFASGTANATVIREILAAWVSTLPLAAVISAGLAAATKL
jgi:PiT family inorganic phosphate transporter